MPIHIAKVLTYPQRVFAHNLSTLRQRVLNGPDVWPGANYVEAADAGKKALKYGDRRRVASELKVWPSPSLAREPLEWRQQRASSKLSAAILAPALMPGSFTTVRSRRWAMWLSAI